MALIEPPISADSVESWHRTADVIVVGLGAAGVSAALEAHRAGADVLVLERASGGGGASAASEGIFYLGGGSTLQKELGYDDDPDNMYAFMRAVTSTPDDVALRTFCDQAAAHFDWLEQQGIAFERAAFTGKAVAVRVGAGLLTTGNEKAWPFRDLARPVPRGHQAQGSLEERGGAPAMRAILATFEREGVPTMYDTRVTGMVVDGGRVVGVRARVEGADVFLQARRGVVLATGSYNLNKDLTDRYLHLLSTTGTPLGIETNDGAGVLLGESVGVATRAMDGAIATASIYPPAELIKGIVVNTNGERFVPEDVYHGRLAHFVSQQPDARAYLILDEEIFAYPEKGKHFVVDGWETVADMEVGLGVPTGSLATTLERYNADVEAGEDSVFHKSHEWLKVLHPPYVAFDISIATSDYHFIALGGLTADIDGRALDAHGAPVPGLYAVGACATHFPQNGDEYASGMSLGPGSWFGRRAGRHAATGSGELG